LKTLYGIFFELVFHIIREVNMRKKIFLFVLFFVFTAFILFANQVYENPHYGHITLLKGKVTVKRLDGGINNAKLNFPIAAGDLIITGKDAHCELQFDNGTIIRLDKDTKLKVNLISAKSLLSSKKITTLFMESGVIYSIVNTYNRELFEVQTDNATVLMHKNSTNIIAYKPKSGDTMLFVKRGQSKIKYGKDVKHLKTKKIKKRQAIKISKDSKLLQSDVIEFNDFLLWNKKINDNFDKLHHGKSVIPKVIYRYSPGIVKFAERWSTQYGKWVYDKIFGYVWVPTDESFHYKRPFVFADYYTVNGKLFIVPQQEWGWIPAHLGTWHWSKERGWVWIPGSVFKESWINIISNGKEFATKVLYTQDFSYYLDSCWGSQDLYLVYRQKGKKKWEEEYKKRFGEKKIKPDFDKVPGYIKKVFKKLENIPVNRLNRYIEKKNFSNKDSQNRIRIINTNKHEIIGRENNYSNIQHSLKIDKVKTDISNKGFYPNFRSFLKDARWALGRKIKLKYDSKTNSIVCPKLGISSKRINWKQRRFLNSPDVTAEALIDGSVDAESFSSIENNSITSFNNSSETSVGSSKRSNNNSVGTNQSGGASKTKKK
jgi:hypothetical protein